MSEPGPPPTFTLHPQLARDTTHVVSLPLCELLLMNDATHPWLVLVPRMEGARELVDLPETAQVSLTREIGAVSRALQVAFAPDKLNVAALGNVVEQLHVHVIARYTTDPAWPRPVWGAVPATPYADGERDARVHTLRALLTGAVD